ncbi:MAG: bestrophin family ion channel [Pseudanabaenaceae cyanobacterium]
MITTVWFATVLQIKASVLGATVPRVAFFVVFSLGVTYCHSVGYFVKSGVLNSLIGNFACNLVLGLLLVFRTNTAYDPYWEGRKSWGIFTIGIGNLAREIKVGIREPTREAKPDKQEVFRLLIAYVIATRQYLRDQFIPSEFDDLLTDEQIQQLKDFHSPLLIITWISHYLHQQFEQGKFIDPLHFQILLIYCLALPFSFVQNLGWWTPLFFILLGVEEIRAQIDDPFGYDPNDLPIEQICENLRDNIIQTSKWRDE